VRLKTSVIVAKRHSSDQIAIQHFKPPALIKLDSTANYALATGFHA